MSIIPTEASEITNVTNIFGNTLVISFADGSRIHSSTSSRIKAEMDDATNPAVKSLLEGELGLAEEAEAFYAKQTK